MAGIKQLRAWFFSITSETRLDGTVGGVRFRNNDKPPQQTFENLLESTAFKTESSDKAKVSTGATLGSEQGLVVLANDTQAKTNAVQLVDRSLAAQPHQLPTAENLDVSVVEDMPIGTMTVDTGASTSRNQYRFRLASTWITWLISRIFKQGGIEGDVPIKTNGTNYNWSWANVGNNTTTVNNIANNANFVSTLLANSSFINSLTTQIITNNPTAITEGLEVGFMRVHPVATMPSAKWLRADGTAINRTTYSALFALVGTTYGVGDGSTTFNLPDFRDKQITGYSGTKALGSTGGAETHTLTSGNLPTHTHTISGTTDNDTHDHDFNTLINGVQTGTGLYIQTQPYNAAPGMDLIGVTTIPNPLTNTSSSIFDTQIEVADNIHNHTFSGNTGDGGFANTAVNHLDPYLATNIIIKVLA